MKYKKDASKNRLGKTKDGDNFPAYQHDMAPGVSRDPINRDRIDDGSELSNNPELSTAEIIDFSEAADSWTQLERGKISESEAGPNGKS